MAGQTINPWLEVAKIGNDPQIGAIWNQGLSQVSDAPAPPRPMMPIYRQIASRTGRLSDLIALCAITPPPEAPPAFRPNPEFMDFIRGVKAAFKDLSAISAVDFYEGRSAQGAKLLSDALKSTYRLQSMSVLAGLVGIADQSIVLAEYEKRMGRLSVTDLENLDATVKSFLNGKPPIVAALRRDRDAFLAFMPEWVQNPWPTVDANGLKQEDLSDLRAKWDLMTPAQRQAEGEKLKAMFDKGYNDVTGRFEGAESSWPGQEKGYVENKVKESLAETVGPSMFISYGGTLGGLVAKAWTQLRLLRLHARIRAFRWHKDRWPATLAEAVGNDALDPIAKKPFTYRLEGGSYFLRSEGWPAIGPIELRFRREANPNQAEEGA